MSTTLTLGATTLTLPDDFDWTDEFAWTAVAAQRSYSVGGALLIDSGLKLAGRPITLAGAVDRAWLTRAEVLALFGWSLLAAPAMTLSYRGQSYAVTWDQVDKPLDVQQVFPFVDPAPTDYCYATLRFITI